MKALKVILSIIFGFNIFVLTIIFSGLTAARMIVSGDNLGNIIKQAAEKEGVIELGFGSTGSVSSKELDKAMEEMSEYVDLDELYDEFGDFASKVINYYFGVSDDIDTAKLKKEIHKIAEKYEKKTGETVNLDEIDESIDEAVKDAKHEMKTVDRDDREALEIVGKFLSNGVYLGVIVGMIIFAGLILLINKSVSTMCVHLTIVSILSMLVNFAIFALTKLIPVEGDLISELLIHNIGGIFIKIALGFAALAFICIVVAVVMKNKKPEKVIV